MSPKPLDTLAEIIDALDQVGVDHMLAGSFASSHHALPRSTANIDLVIEAKRAAPSGNSSSPQVTSTTVSPGTGVKCRTFAAATDQPRLSALAATRRSCAPISTPDADMSAQILACERATRRSNGTIGNTARIASTNASRRASWSGPARCTPWRSSLAVIAASAAAHQACRHGRARRLQPDRREPFLPTWLAAVRYRSAPTCR